MKLQIIHESVWAIDENVLMLSHKRHQPMTLEFTLGWASPITLYILGHVQPEGRGFATSQNEIALKEGSNHVFVLRASPFLDMLSFLFNLGSGATNNRAPGTSRFLIFTQQIFESINSGPDIVLGPEVNNSDKILTLNIYNLVGGWGEQRLGGQGRRGVNNGED